MKVHVFLDKTLLVGTGDEDRWPAKSGIEVARVPCVGERISLHAGVVGGCVCLVVVDVLHCVPPMVQHEEAGDVSYDAILTVDWSKTTPALRPR